MRRRASSAEAAFTLIELVLALAIGALVALLGAKVSETVFRASGQGAQAADLVERSRVSGDQFRADLDNVGMGSSGAIGVDNTVAPWDSMAFQTPPEFPAIATIRGLDNVSGLTIGASNVLDNSDIIQMVVPDGGTVEQLTNDVASGTNALTGIVDLPPVADCPFVYISDSSAPNGAGRAQLAQRAAGTTGSDGVTPAQIVGVLRFNAAVGASVACARVSTYWVDDRNWLRRTDLTPGVAVEDVSGGLWVSPDDTLADRIAPGVLDLQVAYRFSSELLPRATPPDNRWAFDAAADNTAESAIVNAASWFETREVRVNMVIRSARRVQDQTGFSMNIAPEENGVVRKLPPQYSSYALRTAASLMNLRAFDSGVGAGVEAEPY